MNATRPACPNFTPTHPEAVCDGAITAFRLGSDDTGGRPALVLEHDGRTIWLDVERDLEAFIAWLRAVV